MTHIDPAIPVLIVAAASCLAILAGYAVGDWLRARGEKGDE